MYRQILLHPDDQRYHTVFWRNNPSESLKEWQMTRVTFGDGVAPFLATRSMRKMAEDELQIYPEGSKVMINDFYVDDLISGTNTVQEAVNVKNQLEKILEKGGMSLRKWTSNSAEFLESLPHELTERALQLFSDEEYSKALGLQWNPSKDTFGFQVSWAVNEGKITKRLLLSEASKLFDPLGWLAPVVINAKLLMQEVWLMEIKWDDEVSQEIQERWIKLRDDLPRLGEIEIPRWMNKEQGDKITLHGFGDASEKAYGAAVYSRIEKGNQVITNLIASKTRVAPKATKTTLPRLELCGAVLVGLNKVENALNLGKIDKFAWSDSMITLGWLNGDPGRWKTFVANRVVEVQNQDIQEWNYVKSTENPSDCASRGITPSELKNHPLWWTGPAWLKDDPKTWIKQPIVEPELEQRKVKTISTNVAQIKPGHVERFSSWQRMIRVTSYRNRWKNGKRGPLTLEEINETTRKIIKECQANEFRKELKRLNKKEPIKRTSNLISLNPFLDKDGIMRVGGRLKNAEIAENVKHPIILPAKHHITDLIIRDMHQDTGHGGPQLVVTLLRKQYWIIQCKRMVNNMYKKCVICKRQAGKVADQLMGDLPAERVNLGRVFEHTGLDYAGPVEIRSSRLRNAAIEKGYIALFICFATRAVHLELVSDQSTDAFLAALQRFIARRGLISDMYSDNGSNFVGAANELDRQLIAVQTSATADYVATKGIKWHFIPPASATFGGLWERNIKSMKTHLKTTLGNTRLTFEEYSTVLCQIEACLNSRPICPLTEDPENLNVLTPGHFLIGDALLAIPQRQLLDNTANKVNRWKFLQLLQQHFWKRWSSEYLHQLQHRRKWQEVEPNIKIGDLVLIKEDDLPPRKWLMGRITKTHQGTDGLIRVATTKTATGSTERGIKKICPLLAGDEIEVPNEEPEDSQGSTRKSRDKKKSKYVLPVTRTLRPRPLKTGLWLAVIAMLMILGGGFGQSISNQSPIQLTRFDHQPGIYFEDMGRAGVIKTEWHMFLYFEMDSYEKELNNLRGHVKKLRELCVADKTNIEIHCTETTNQLHKKVKEIDRLNELLRANGEHRQRRGAPLGFVGWIQNELFGVLDEDHANKMQADILQVHDEEEHLKRLIRNQTSIADITTDLMKSTEDEINRNYLKIKMALDTLTNTTVLSRKKEEILGWSIYVSLMLDQFEKLQNELISAITNLHQGHVSSHLFTPEAFHEQLATINSNLPLGNAVPESPQADLKSLYKLLRGKVRVTSKMIVIDMILPLIATEEYQMFREIAVPTQRGEHRISIIPSSKYLMITLGKDNFYQMDDNEYNTCLKTKTKSICWIRHPIYNMQSNQSRCERDLLARKPGFSEFCQFKISPETDVWIQLQQRNKWIYGLKHELTLNVICNNEVFAIKAEGTGLMEIRPGCEIMQPEMTITAEAHKQSKGSYDFNPMLNLSTTEIKNNFQVLNLTIDHTHQLTNIHNQLQQVREQTEIEQYHHLSHYTLNAGIAIIVVITAVIIWIIRDKIKKVYDTTSHVSETVWRQWRLQSQRRFRRGTNSPARSSDDSRPVRLVPLFGTRREDVQSGHGNRETL